MCVLFITVNVDGSEKDTNIIQAYFRVAAIYHNRYIGVYRAGLCSRNRLMMDDGH